jgi:DNA-binding transcriptional MerR regulator
MLGGIMELTIDQLAQRVGMSTRNIREWQRLGLVSPPERRGRMGIYSQEHVTRIERVQKLHAQGLPLDLIRRLTATGKGPEGDIRHLADEVLRPFADAGTSTRTDDIVDQLTQLGISRERLDQALKEIQHHQHEIARQIIDVYRVDVWEPFQSSGFTAGDWGAIADDVARLKPLVIELLAGLLDAAVDDVAGDVLLSASIEAQRRLDET